MFLDTAALAWVQDVMLETIELHPCGDHLSQELAEGVKEADRLKRLGHVVLGFVWLRDDDARRLLEPPRPYTG